MLADKQQPGKPLLSPGICQEIDAWFKRFPPEKKRSALLAALRIAQHHNGGYLTVAWMDEVAEHLGLAPVEVYEVAEFYSMLETKPVGRHSISVCTNISCMLRGSDAILRYLEEKLDIKAGGSTPDGRFYLKREEECLAACCAAPMLMIDHEYHEELTPKKIDQILKRYP